MRFSNNLWHKLDNICSPPAFFTCSHALMTLTRMMPKDGRKDEYRFVGYYSNHGKSVDAAVLKMGDKATPMIQVILAIAFSMVLWIDN